MTRLIEDDCIEWDAAIFKSGYGQVRFRGVPWLAHRVAWTETFGEIPKGKHVLHKCDNKPCINTDHLFLGTQKENMADMRRKGREGRKLRDDNVREIRSSKDDGVTLAKKFGVHPTTVSLVRRGQTWKNVAVALFVAVAALVPSSPVFAQIEFKQGRVWVDGERRDDTVWMRSCFKHANYLSYHFTGNGGGPFYSLGTARAFVDYQRSLGIEGCRVLLESAGWADSERGQPDNGKPATMFGGESRDKGTWNVEQLRNGGRPTQMHGVARNSLEWYYSTSEETGFIFEVVIIATLKHDDVDVGTQTHVVRQTLAEARVLQGRYPRAKVVLSAINEWNAHSAWTIQQVNMLAVRAARCKHPDGRTEVVNECSPGFEPEQFPGAPLIVDGGGGNTFSFDVGAEPGKFRLGAVHPDRGDGWEKFPTPTQQATLVRDSRGQPWAITEFMYLCEPGEAARTGRGATCRDWYGVGGWTTDTAKYASMLAHLGEIKAPYVVLHDECGVGSILGWPVADCWLDRWSRENLPGAHDPPVDPPPDVPPVPPPTAMLYYDEIIELGYQTILRRPADPEGLDVYNKWFRECYADEERICYSPFVDVLARSDEYMSNNTR